ncbi:unnamed protein product [Prunus armeniaca]
MVSTTKKAIFSILVPTMTSTSSIPWVLVMPPTKLVTVRHVGIRSFSVLPSSIYHYFRDWDPSNCDHLFQGIQSDPTIVKSSSLDHLLEGIQHDSVLVRAPTNYSKMNLVAKRILLGNLLPPVSPVDILSVLFEYPYLDYFNSYKIGFCKHLCAILVPKKDAVLPLNSPLLCSGQLESWPAILSYRIPPTFYYSCQWHIISWYFNWHFLPWLLSYFSDVLGRLLIGFLSGCAPGWSWNYGLLVWCFDSVQSYFYLAFTFAPATQNYPS